MNFQQFEDVDYTVAENDAVVGTDGAAAASVAAVDDVDVDDDDSDDDRRW